MLEKEFFTHNRDNNLYYMNIITVDLDAKGADYLISHHFFFPLSPYFVFHSRDSSIYCEYLRIWKGGIV